jgi:hypothetical protein
LHADNAKSLLWGRIEKLMDILHVCCIQVWHLQRVLSKIRDPSTHVCLLDELVKVYTLKQCVNWMLA